MKIHSILVGLLSACALLDASQSFGIAGTIKRSVAEQYYIGDVNESRGIPRNELHSENVVKGESSPGELGGQTGGSALRRDVDQTPPTEL